MSERRPRLGLFVGEKGNWSFFRDIASDLAQHYETDTFAHTPPRVPFLRGRLNRVTFERALRSLLRRSHLAFFEWASELLVPASHMPKVCPIVARLHSFELYAWAPQVNWTNVDRIILVSQAMRQKFVGLYPDHADKAVVVYNGCSLDRFRQREPTGRFRGQLGMLCTLYPRKRVYDVVLMLHELRNEGVDVHLHVAGGVVHGPDLDEYAVALQRLTDKLNLRSHVTFHDHQADPSGWFANVDLFISHSYWEGHQVALIEAMASGCYCLSHFWDGAEEVLPTSQIYATDSELRGLIREYAGLDDAARATRQRAMANVAAQRFDIEDTKANIRRVLADVLHRR